MERRTELSFLSIVLLSAVLTGSARAQLVTTREEALALHFKGLKVDRKTVFLTDKQVEEIQARARAKVSTKILVYYVARDEKGIADYAFFETQTVRTMPETYMVVIHTDGTVGAVELFSFFEPEDYRPPVKWLNQFNGVSLNDNLWLKRGIQNIVGATLTAHSITEGVRRILAEFAVAVPKE